MSPSSANSRPEFVNTLVQHRVDYYERQQARRPARTASPVVSSCLCLVKPPVAPDTEFRRYTCGCQRRWIYRSREGWFPTA